MPAKKSRSQSKKKKRSRSRSRSPMRAELRKLTRRQGSTKKSKKRSLGSSPKVRRKPKRQVSADLRQQVRARTPGAKRSPEYITHILKRADKTGGVTTKQLHQLKKYAAHDKEASKQKRIEKLKKVVKKRRAARRAMSAYNLFVKERASEGVGFVDIGIEWKRLSENQKHKWQAKASKHNKANKLGQHRPKRKVKGPWHAFIAKHKLNPAYRLPGKAGKLGRLDLKELAKAYKRRS